MTSSSARGSASAPEVAWVDNVEITTEEGDLSKCEDPLSMRLLARSTLLCLPNSMARRRARFYRGVRL